MPACNSYSQWSFVLCLLMFVGCRNEAAMDQQSQRLSIAAAANLQPILPELVQRFKSEQGVEDISVQFGSSGVLTQQIIYGADFDVFLSADAKFVEQLVEKLPLSKDAAFDYATGQLAIYMPQGKLSAERITFEAIPWTQFSVVAIANPEVAPYGRAAQEALGRSLGQEAELKLVFAADATAVLQLIQSGAADAGLTAASLKSLAEGMSVIDVPSSYHQPLRQSGAILKDNRELAAQFVQYLTAESSQSICRQKVMAPSFQSKLDRLLTERSDMWIGSP